MTTTGPLAPIQKRPLADVVYDRLLAGIIAGDLTAGTRLNLDDAAAAFAVSRTPVRDAIVRLTRAQLVNVHRNASTIIADWGVADMRMRVQLIGGMLHAIAADLPLPLRPRTLPDPGPSHARAFIDTARAITNASDITIARENIEELAAPLELFLDDQILSAHHIDPTQINLSSPLGALNTASTGRDNRALVAAIDILTRTLSEGLRTRQHD